MRYRECGTCHGRAWKPVVQAVIRACQLLYICNLGVYYALDLFKTKLQLTKQEGFIAAYIFKKLLRDSAL